MSSLLLSDKIQIPPVAFWGFYSLSRSEWFWSLVLDEFAEVADVAKCG